MLKLAALIVSACSIALTAPALAQTSADWQAYVDSEYGFTAELPLGRFEVVAEENRPGIALQEIGGAATINLYGGPAEGLTRDALETRLESGSNASATTYRAGGDSWFVLSGFYDQEGLEDTIFYTKVLFSSDHQTFSAFEITFPTEEKPRFEALVERFEDNFTRPRT